MATPFDVVRDAPRSDWSGQRPGSITASCGCRVFEDCGEHVTYHDGDGLSYAMYCPYCANKLKVSGYYIDVDDEGNPV